jgi:type IV pilus assembly protein PilA
MSVPASRTPAARATSRQPAAQKEEWHVTTHYRAAGFTLIELMITIAIIGILASVAIPAYQTYVIRSRVSNAVIAASAAKVAVAEYFFATGELPPGGDNDAAGFDDAYDSPYIESVDWHSEQRIEVEFNEAALGITSQLELGLDPQPSASGLLWRCAQDGNVSDENLKYLPANCRGRL